MDSHLEPASAPINGALRTGECLSLLRSVAAGRLIYTDNALPAVWPVTFAAPDGRSSSLPEDINGSTVSTPPS